MLTQQLLARFLASGAYERQLTLARREHRARRDAALASVRRHLGDLAALTASPGGAPLWLRLRRPLDERALYRVAIASGVSFTPGFVMFVEEPRATYLRLCYSRVPRGQIDEGVGRLARAIRTLDAGAARTTSMRLA